MFFNAELFDGKSSAGQSCTVICNENMQFSVNCQGEITNLANISWQQTSTRLVLTSISLGSYANIVITDPSDCQEILKFLSKLKKPEASHSKAIYVYFGIIGFFTGLWLFLDSLIFLIPTSIEPWLEQQALLVHFYKNKSLADDSNNQTLSKIKNAFIAIDSELKGIKIDIIDCDEINAVTLPNKRVLVYSKLIKQAQSIDEFMGILAHEVTHVKYRHCIAAHVKLSFLDMIDKIISGGALSQSGVIMYFLQFSRDNEMQADEGAIKYLDQLQLSTDGIKDFFVKSELKEKSAKSKFWDYLDFLSTHPSSVDRSKLFDKHKKTYVKSDFTKDDLKKLKNLVATQAKSAIKDL